MICLLDLFFNSLVCSFTSRAELNTHELNRFAYKSALLGHIVTRVDYTGVLQIAAHPSAITCLSTVGIHRPVQFIRLSACASMLKASKLEIIMRLHAAGWRGHEQPRSFLPDGEQLYRLKPSLPLNYFAALASACDIFAKAVDVIEYGRSEFYYRCLVVMPAAQLAPLIASMNEYSADNDWFQSKFKDGGHIVPDQEDHMDTVPAPIAPGSDADNGAELVPIAMDVPSSEWEGAVVHMGAGSYRLKVYFTHLSDGSSRQRGFSNCPCPHACIRYVPTWGDRKELCADMYALVQAGMSSTEFHSRQDHLCHRVQRATVDELIPRISLERF